MKLHSILKQSIAFDDSHTVRLTEIIAPKAFTQLNTLFKRLDGKWDSSADVFRFTRNAEALVERILNLGTRAVNAFHLYPSNDHVFNFMKEYTALSYVGAGRKEPIKVLEPSIGLADLALRLRKFADDEGRQFDIKGYDIDPLNVMLCEENGFDVDCTDFLDVQPEPIYDLVIMNPPFDKSLFIEHIRHAHKFLTPTGELIAVIPVNEKRITDSDWLYERIRHCCPEQLEEGNYLAKDTFKHVSIDTTVITMHAEPLYQRSLKSPRTHSSQIDLFNLCVDNDEQWLSEMSAIANQHDSEARQKVIFENCVTDMLTKHIGLHPHYRQEFVTELTTLYGTQSKPLPAFSIRSLLLPDEFPVMQAL